MDANKPNQPKIELTGTRPPTNEDRLYQWKAKTEPTSSPPRVPGRPRGVIFATCIIRDALGLVLCIAFPVSLVLSAAAYIEV